MISAIQPVITPVTASESHTKIYRLFSGATKMIFPTKWYDVPQNVSMSTEYNPSKNGMHEGGYERCRAPSGPGQVHREPWPDFSPGRIYIHHMEEDDVQASPAELSFYWGWHDIHSDNNQGSMTWKVRNHVYDILFMDLTIGGESFRELLIT